MERGQEDNGPLLPFNSGDLVSLEPFHSILYLINLNATVESNFPKENKASQSQGSAIHWLMLGEVSSDENLCNHIHKEDFKGSRGGKVKSGQGISLMGNG